MLGSGSALGLDPQSGRHGMCVGTTGTIHLARGLSTCEGRCRRAFTLMQSSDRDSRLGIGSDEPWCPAANEE